MQDIFPSVSGRTRSVLLSGTEILIDTKSVLSRRQELRELLGPLEGKLVNPAYGIEAFNGDYFPNLGGYVSYRYK